MDEKLPFEEGASINKPPLFCGLNYKYWKVRMKVFVESIDQGIWDAIENGPFIPKVEKGGSFTKKPWSQWTNEESEKAKFDCIAKDIITSAVNSNEFFRISQCEPAKEIWVTLEVIDEGTNENEEKVLNMFKKLRKFLKKRISKRDSSKRYENKNSVKVKTNNYACLEYGEQGYTKAKRLKKKRRKENQEKLAIMNHQAPLQVKLEKLISV